MRLQLVRAKPTSGTQVRWMAPKEGSYVSMLGNMFEEDGRLLAGGTNRDVSCHGQRLSEREVGRREVWHNSRRDWAGKTRERQSATQAR